jgi:CheY-like chemotaxis protein
MSALEGGLLPGTRVLVVDDDADNRAMLAMTLEHCGARVATAGTAAEALRVLQDAKERPQVLISDIGLPDEDGFSLLRKVRALPESLGGDIPAIALTGRSRHEDRRQVREEDFQVHLTKPVTPEAILAAIAHVMQSAK